MRKFNKKYLFEDGLVVMTTNEIADNSAMFIADFRDSFALCHKKSGKLIGLDRNACLRLGAIPELVDGIWQMKEDVKMREIFYDVVLSPSELDFKKI